MRERNNDQWVERLQGPKRDEALADLRAVLLRGLRAALYGRTGVTETLVEDFVQEALIKILGNLDSFRGESRFTVWAQKIAIRTAYAEMRRLRWRDVSLEDVTKRHGESGSMPADPLEDTEKEAAQRMIMSEFRRFVDEELTEKQRTALLAAMGGMPLEAVADRMGTNRNALYKVLHDARKRLKERMLAESFSPYDVLGVFNG